MEFCAATEQLSTPPTVIVWVSILPLAFVMVTVESGTEKEVLEELRKVDVVKEAHFVYGVYDIVVKAEAENMETLKQAITWKIRRVPKVRSTLTMIVMGER
jgi:DNA-binding Lrp family transcriptional regulator